MPKYIATIHIRKYIATIHIRTQTELTEKQQEDLESFLYEMDLTSGSVEYVDVVNADKF